MCHTGGLFGALYRVFAITYMCHNFTETKKMCHIGGYLGHFTERAQSLARVTLPLVSFVRT